MFCTKCGAELLEEARFCGRCGAAVAKPEAVGTDAELERLAAQGDREAFAELYSRHSGRVFDFLLRMVGDPDEASDLMQDTFLRAMRALSPEEKGAAFSTWVLTIARNLALKRLERRRRTVTLAPREASEEAPVFDQVDPDRLADPQAAAEAQELAGLVWEAASGLDAKQYSLLDLHVRQGLESAEIAEVLGVSKGNAYTMVSRLRDTFESAVASLFMLRVGRRDCPELNRLLQEQSITALSPTVRRLIEGHVAECEACQERRRKLVAPANILGSFAAVPLPLLLKQRVAEALAASWAQAGTQAAATGLKGLLSQPTAKLSSLSTTWKAVIIGGALVVATGGGLSTYVAVTGGLPGSGGGESPVVAPAAAVTPGPASSTLPVVPTGQPSGVARKIVFRSDRDAPGLEIGDIYMMDATGGSVQRLGAGGHLYEIDFDSGLSPDGSKVAFYECPEHMDEQNKWAELVVTNADGTGPVTIATGTFVCNTDVGAPGSFSWSPDSTRIVFYRDVDPSGLYIANADGSNLRYLTAGFSPEWSPLGDSIAFLVRPGPAWQCEIHLINPDGTNRRLLARVPCEGEGTFCNLLGPRPRWSPDGSMLAFSASLEEARCQPEPQPDPQRDVFVLAADGSGLTNITNSPSDDYDPIWVDCRVPTAGCEAKVTSVQPDSLSVRQEPKTKQNDPPIVAQLNEGDVVCLVGVPVFDGGNKWWPVSAADGPGGWVAAFGPKDPARPWITLTGEPCGGAVSTAPTGQPLAEKGKIVFRSNRDGSQPPTSGVYAMDAHGGGVTHIGSQSGWPSFFPDLSSQWSPDGSKVAFQKCPDSASEGIWGAFYIMNADGSGLTTVATNTIRCFTEGTGGGVSWSPDGSRIAFLRGGEPSGLYVADADGGNLRYLADGIFPQWSPLGDSIAFTDVPGPEQPCDMYSIDPDGANKRHLASVPCEGDYVLEGPRLQWSPDGSMLAFSTSLEEPATQPQSQRQRDIFVMRADGSGLTNITNSPSDDYDPVWVDCSMPTAGCEAKVTNVQPGPLNARASPGMDQDITAKLSEGDTVCIVGSPSLGSGYKWWPISTTDGTEGWVAAFDPEHPARPWITPTGEPCSGEAEESTAPSSGGERAVCKNPARLGESVSDPEGDVPFAFVDIVGARVEAIGEEVTAEIELKDIPEELTFNQAPQPTLEYGWQIFFDVDGDPSTGNALLPVMIGAEYSLSILHFSEGDSQQVKTGTLLENTQADAWKRDLTGEGWSTDWRTDTATSTATAAVDDLGNVLTIQGTIPGLGPNTRWCAEALYQNPDGRGANDAAPD
jgi:RNA polymerase sigma factor (sigma-70 family)